MREHLIQFGGNLLVLLVIYAESSDSARKNCYVLHNINCYVLHFFFKEHPSLYLILKRKKCENNSVHSSCYTGKQEALEDFAFNQS